MISEDDPDFEPLEDAGAAVPRSAVERRAGGLGRDAAKKFVSSDPDALWIDNAQGQNVLTERELRGARGLVDRAARSHASRRANAKAESGPIPEANE